MQRDSDKPAAKPPTEKVELIDERSPAQRLIDLTRRVVAVPKAEAEKAARKSVR